jgi:hypothetical protein
MRSSPYKNLPSSRFWSSGVVRSGVTVPVDLYKKKWPISQDEKIATAGSCFAQHIGRNLKKNGFQVMDVELPPQGLKPEDQARFGYSIYSARYGNIYTTHQLLQLAREAFGEIKLDSIVWEGERGSYYDALRPNVEPEGLESPGEVIAHREYHLERVREMFETMDLFIFTMGLTEAWQHKESGIVYPMAPGTIAGDYLPERYNFKNYRFDEVMRHFLEFKDLIHSKRAAGKPRFLLTVSPVPLTATATENHVMVATAYSKAVLRAVAGELSATHSDIDYFPSYEIVSNPWARDFFYESNLRSVKQTGVDAVMLTFAHEYFSTGLNGEGSPKAKPFNQPKIPQNPNEDVICEEAILDAFAGDK